ncbi:glycogen/starch/alpha-glucan phosphorylase [Bengtsoniella intestinalis]|uniref:glycogen/starch/alpha-glucan phosphorylase n=1 Tax=Bengtsoniella intestinalis TaxID=3073143 RepID=UPI00391EE84C
MKNFTTETLQQAITDKLMIHFGKAPEDATEAEIVRACARVMRDRIAIRGVETRTKTRKQGDKQVHYLSLEFLMGRSLMKNAYNLGSLKMLNEALTNMGFTPADVFEAEPDAALGNGGLGRLAACYIDSMTTLEIPATGYSICYDLGIFKQKIVDGQQVELPDSWKDVGEAWLLPRPEDTKWVRFGGTVRDQWDNGYLHIVHEGGQVVRAVPCDMEIAGYDTDHVNTLRLWDAQPTKQVDMSMYSRGEYMKATEEEAMAEVIAKVLYPEDNHYEGKSLRLKQQYFFVSATVQHIVQKHVEAGRPLTNFHEYNVIQINDTHPALVVPELMRIFIDEAGLDWEQAWDITTQAVAYTNHTVLAEALERWPQDLFQTLLPRIWQIVQEISNRWQAKVDNHFHNHSITADMAIVWNGEIRMANLCIAGGMAVNGVSGLHSEILRKDVFKNACNMEPHKFKNVTNGIDHRRWLSEINPEMDSLICELTGSNRYLSHADDMMKLDAFADDKTVLAKLAEIKHANKVRFAKHAKKTRGVILNPDSIFDVQVKRLHEYKRQLLNVVHIISLYQKLQDDPNAITVPHTFLFGAKAAPGYQVAKRIIHLINSLSDEIDHNPACKGKLQVVFLENYRVSLAEQLIPASEVSQQISTAGKEASGTGNMKFMMNGALTVGTLDGANVEMHGLLGDENMFLFGLHAHEVEQLIRDGYDPQRIYQENATLHRALDALRNGFRDGVRYDDLYQRLVYGNHGSCADEYLLLADFADYAKAEARMSATYADPTAWNKMSLHNIARSGLFSADRSIADYAETIWHTNYRK